MKKLSLPLMVTVMCLMVSLVLGLFWLNQKRQSPIKKISETEKKITRTDYSAVARKTLDWIDKQRNDEEWYILERGCDFEAKTCDTVWDNAEGNKDGLIATWARFNYYQQTKDPADLEIVKSDINKFYEKYPDGVDNALWICKITYDMYSSGVFDEEMNKKLEEICFNTNFPTPNQVGEYWQTTRNNQMEKISKGESWKTWEGYGFLIRGFDASLGYADDMLSRYFWKKDLKYLDLAKGYLDEIQKTWDNGSIKYSEDICLTGISSLDMYELGDEDQNSLDFTTALYDKTLGDITVEFKYNTAMCGLFAKRLYKITKEEKYLSKLETISRVLAKTRLDGGMIKVVDDQAFFKTDNKNGRVLYKNVVENGLVVELLRN